MKPKDFYKKLLMPAVLSTFVVACIENKGSETVEATDVERLTPTIPVPDVSMPIVPVEPKQPDGEPPFDGNYGDIGIEIDGPLVTNNNIVKVKIKHDYWANMRVGIGLDCNRGEWEPASTSKTITLPPENLIYDIYVQFTDEDFTGRPPCLYAQVKYDTEAPKIIFVEYPAQEVSVGEPVRLVYEVTDFSKIETTQCYLNTPRETKDCPSGGPHEILWKTMPVGEYVFTIGSVDELGQKSKASIAWRVTDKYKIMNSSFQLNNYRKVDVLMVIDNSGSMAYEQQSMAKRVANFLSLLKGLDWQIGVTTTDPRDITLGDGRLVPLHDIKRPILFEPAHYILTSQMDPRYAQEQLGLTLQRRETGYHLEQGIRAVYRALERGLVPGTFSPNHALVREGAHLAAVVISDEDESASTDKNDPHKLMEYIRASHGGNKNFSFHSIITKPGDKKCLNGHGATYGYRYLKLSELTGGVVGSVCAEDYAEQVSGIANGIRDLLKTLTLDCVPLEAYPITITHNGVPYLEPFAVEGLNLKFNTELPPGDFVVNYACLR